MSQDRTLSMTGPGLGFALVLLAACLMPAGRPLLAQEQGDEYRPILDRLDRLERDLNLLQRQVYRGKVDEGDQPPATAGGAQPAVSSNAAADMELRLNALETEIRGSTGHQEEIKHAVDELRTRLDKLVADVDARLTAMEQNVAKAKPAEPTPAAAQAAEPQPGTASTAPPPGKPGETTETTLIVPGGAAGAAPAPATEAATAPGEASLPQGTPIEQYQYARALLAKADYPGAEKTLKAFLKAYPNSELTENAEYWLGETYYVRSNYTDAAVTYADGYKRFSNGSKAPDNLLKLGLSLGNLGQNDQACKAFAEIDKKFPTARADIRERADTERKQRSCK